MVNFQILSELSAFLLLTVMIRVSHGQVDPVTTESTPSCETKMSDGIQQLHCSEFTEIPRDFKMLASSDPSFIRLLNMSGNHLKQINANEFTELGLTNLKYLQLSKNEIREIQHGAFKDLDSLIELDLSSNKIETLDMRMFGQHENLKNLYLQNNSIFQLVDHVFLLLPGLTTLDLSNCDINQISKLAFTNLTNLNKLDLSGNQLSSLNWEALKPLSALTHLSLKANPWNCDCHVKFLKDFLLDMAILPNSIKCASPEMLSNKSWADIQPNEFTCHPKITSLDIITHKHINEESVVYPELGADIVFECVAESYPAPEVTWLKNDKLLDSDTIGRKLDDKADDDGWIEMGKTSSKNVNVPEEELKYTYLFSNLLKIYKSKAEDVGTYSCSVATDGVGNDIKSINLNFTNLNYLPGEDDKFIPTTGGSKAWLWIIITLIILIIIAAFILCFGMWRRRERKRQKVLKQQMLEKFKDSQIIIDDADMQPKRLLQRQTSEGASAPLLTPLNGSRGQIQKLSLGRIPDVATGNPEYVRDLSPEVFSPRPPSTADMKRQFFASRQMSEPPIPSSRPGSAMSASNLFDPNGRRLQFIQKPYPGSVDQAERYYTPYYRTGSSLSLAYPDPRYHPQQIPQMTREYSGPSMPPAYATMRFARDRRPPSTSSFISEPAHDNNYRAGLGYVTLPRGFAPPRADSGFGRSLSPTESTYSSYSTATLPHRRGNIDPRTGVLYDAVGPRTSVDGGSSLSLNRIGESRPSDVLDSINQGLFSPTRGKVKTGRNRTGSSTTPGSIRGRNDFFSFEPIQEVEGSDDVLVKLPSNHDIDKLLPKIHTPRSQDTRFAKKKAPMVTIPPKSRKPVRTFEYSKYPDKRDTEAPSKLSRDQPIVQESSVDGPLEFNGDSFHSEPSPKLPTNPPPKPTRLQSSIENIFDLKIQPTIAEEVTVTEV